MFVTHDVDEAIRLGDRVYVLTERPASVAVVIDVDLPRPRPYEAVLSRQFARLKAIALQHLHTEATGNG
jgi:NitT/TauT family transport system ATP-binding protein